MGKFGNPETRDWSKRKTVDYEAQPAMSLGYDNLMFPFFIIICGTAIAGKSYSLGSKRSSHINYFTYPCCLCRNIHLLRADEILFWQNPKPNEEAEKETETILSCSKL